MNINIKIQRINRNYSFKVLKKHVVVTKYFTHSLKRFSKKIGTINWNDLIKNGQSVYLKVGYGKRLDCFGKSASFTNEGIYHDNDSFYLAWNAFVEND